jgi:Na+-transporting methylmalonyl-CoA/oxaloacetate decarboxylase gamma subunit
MRGTEVRETVTRNVMYEAMTWLGCTALVVLTGTSVALFSGLDVVFVVLYFMTASAFLMVLIGAGVQRSRMEAAMAKKTPAIVEPVSIATARRLRRAQLLREEAKVKRDVTLEREIETEESGGVTAGAYEWAREHAGNVISRSPYASPLYGNTGRSAHQYVSTTRGYTNGRGHGQRRVRDRSFVTDKSDDIEITNQTDLTIDGYVNVPKRFGLQLCADKGFTLQPGEMRYIVSNCAPSEVILTKPEAITFSIPEAKRHKDKPAKMTIRRNGNQFISTAPPGYYT